MLAAKIRPGRATPGAQRLIFFGVAKALGFAESELLKKWE
jgi:hypothetical protein